MTAIEWLSTLLGIACVALAARRSVWTFPLGIASVTLLGIVVWRARLYSDAGLQAFFVAANAYGWWNWRAARAQAGEVVVESLTSRARIAWSAGIVVATLAWGSAMHRLTDAALPYWDAGIAMASVAAQVLMARRKLENWLIWIVVDLASVPLYGARGLYPFAGLYLVYLGLAIWGLAAWRRAGVQGGAA